MAVIIKCSDESQEFIFFFYSFNLGGGGEITANINIIFKKGYYIEPKTNAIFQRKEHILRIPQVAKYQSNLKW